MALLTPIAVPGSAATAITFASAAAGGDTVAYKKDKVQIIIIKKGAGANSDTTVTAARTSVPTGRDVAALSNMTFSVVTNTSRAILVTPAYVASTGLVSIAYSNVTNLSVAVLEL